MATHVRPDDICDDDVDIEISSNYSYSSAKDVRDRIRGYRNKYGKYLVKKETPTYNLRSKVSADHFEGHDDDFKSTSRKDIFAKFTIKIGKINDEEDDSGIDLENKISDTSILDDDVSISSSVLNNSYGNIFGKCGRFTSSSEIFERRNCTQSEEVLFKPPDVKEFAFKLPEQWAGQKSAKISEMQNRPVKTTNRFIKARENNSQLISDEACITLSKPKKAIPKRQFNSVKNQAVNLKTYSQSNAEFKSSMELSKKANLTKNMNEKHNSRVKLENVSNKTKTIPVVEKKRLNDQSKVIKRYESAISKMHHKVDRILDFLSENETPTDLKIFINDLKIEFGELDKSFDTSVTKKRKNRAVNNKENVNKKTKQVFSTDDLSQETNYHDLYFSQNSNYSDYFNYSVSSQSSQSKMLYSVSDLIKCNSQDYIQEISTTLSSQGFNEGSVVLADVFKNTENFIKTTQIMLVNEESVPEINVEVVINDYELSAGTDHQNLLTEALAKMKQNPDLKYNERNKVSVRTKAEVLARIRNVFIGLKEDLQNGKKMAIRLARFADWRNVVFKDNVLMCKKDGSIMQIRSFGRSTCNFKLVIYLLMKIYTLSMTGATCTKREIYYQIMAYVDNQEKVNSAYNVVCCLLDTPPWVLGIMPSGRGLVYGNLNLIINQTSINCNIKGGILIPQDVKDIRRIETNASFVMIVEKDSIFQKMLDEDTPNKLSRPFILITGKGYPDTNTRFFAKKLSVLLRLPMFILVDADPFGIEIMLCYRFGSLSTSFLSRELALPNLRWIGVHPSEIQLLSIPSFPLSESDKKKIDHILKRPYMDHHPKIRLQLNLLKKRNFKAEIEGLIKCNHSLSNFYIPNKLCTQDFI